VQTAWAAWERSSSSVSAEKSSSAIAHCEDEAQAKEHSHKHTLVQLANVTLPQLMARLHARHDLEALRPFWSICYTITA
jgi:hypothetical protein